MTADTGFPFARDTKYTDADGFEQLLHVRGATWREFSENLTAARQCLPIPAVAVAPVVPARPQLLRDAPLCPEHGRVKASKRPGSFFCPAKTDNGEYCKWTGKAA